MHYIDDVQTSHFLQALQNLAGHKITVDLSSFYGGGLLKRSELRSDDISVITETGAAFPIVVSQANKSTTNSIQKKILENKTNEEIFSHKIASSAETIHYLPFSKNF